MVAVAALALVGVPLVSASSASASCTTYYVSSSSGSDSNSGCSTASPWLTLANVNSTTFTAGNQILFQAGGSWTGELQPQGSGASGSPIIISSYGTGAAPIIAGGGAAAAVYLHDQQYWTVENLEITNVSSTQGSRAGFLAYNDGTGILNSIHLVNNTIDNVDGYWGSSDPQPVATSAIGFETTDSNATANWNDVLIQGNTLTHDDAGGIYIGSPVGLNRNITSTNVVIQNNTITDAGGNSIVCVFCSAPLIQYNVDTDSGYRFSGAALWEGWSNNAVWQYNEVARNWRALFDGEAFDIDNNNTNTTIQYNYTHDNPWGFMEFCCSSTFGALGTSIVRDNISQNDGASNAVFSTLGGLETGATAQIYNNTVYMAPGDNGSVTNGAPPTGSSISFTNNLIYKLGTGGYSSGNMTWSHNLMYGNHPTSEPTDAAKITADPLLVNPGRAGSGLATASVYKLRSGSPALGAGAVVSGNGGLDYFGNAVSSTAAPNIGAYNGAAVAAATPTVGAYWRFDEGSGTAAYDSSGGANTGTLQAGASWTTGEMGTSAVALTGASNSYVDVPSTAIDTSGSYSVSAWVKPNSLTGNQTYASIDGTTISPFYLQLTGGQFAFTVRSADSTSSTATQALGLTPTTGTWYELTGVYDNVAHTITLYVNGVKQATTAFSSPWKATGDTEIGRAKWNGSSVDFANATIDEVRMQPKAINTQEAFALGTGATAYYELDEGSGSTFSDATGSTPAGHLESQTGWTGSGEIGSNSLSFTGTTGTFAEIPVSAVNTSQSYTVAAWVKLNSVAGTQTFAAMSGSDISPFYLQIAGGKLTFTVRSADSTSSTATSVSATASASTGTWYHVLGMYNLAAGTISLYVNGTLQGTASYTTPWQSVGATTIGAAEFGLSPVDLTNGLIDDVHFCNRTLTAAQITTLATS
ncbi:MAG: LamG protein [Frondihabitans sp.]|nr:LamG protein [Frondihabitans sp.]